MDVARCQYRVADAGFKRLSTGLRISSRSAAVPIETVSKSNVLLTTALFTLATLSVALYSTARPPPPRPSVLGTFSGGYRGGWGQGGQAPLQAHIPTLPLQMSVESKAGKRDFKTN